jgi:hypothetical protein
MPKGNVDWNLWFDWHIVIGQGAETHCLLSLSFGRALRSVVCCQRASGGGVAKTRALQKPSRAAALDLLTPELTGPAPAARTLENECWCQRSANWSPLSAGSGVERNVRIGALSGP